MYLFTSVSAVAALTGYEIFFAVQVISLKRKAHIVCSTLDARVPFVAHWVWIYGVLYYALVGLPLAFFNRLDQCLTFICGGLAILFLSAPVFLLWPTTCPPQWRRFERTGISSRFLAFIQQTDLGRNCCPSLHCTLSAYAATFIPSHIFLFAMPALICLSCIFVKQHSVVELPVSLLFGFVIGFIVKQLI
jgi:hypothetical protein